MSLIKKFSNFFKKEDNHIQKVDLERICYIIDDFAEDNNLGMDIKFDYDTLKDINYYTKYNSRAELQEAHNNNTDINFRLYSNNLEFIIIEDTHGYMDLEDNWDKYPDGNKLMNKMFALYSRMKKVCPHLKYEMPKGLMKWNIKITKS